jgi:hypothetical protein
MMGRAATTGAENGEGCDYGYYNRLGDLGAHGAPRVRWVVHGIGAIWLAPMPLRGGVDIRSDILPVAPVTLVLRSRGMTRRAVVPIEPVAHANLSA